MGCRYSTHSHCELPVPRWTRNAYGPADDWEERGAIVQLPPDSTCSQPEPSLSQPSRFL